MQHSAQTSSSPAASSFAGLLAMLTSPAPKPPEQKNAPAGNGDDLGDDVATLSYERALRAHARYKPDDHVNWSAIPAAAPAKMPPATEAAPLPEEAKPAAAKTFASYAKQAGEPTAEETFARLASQISEPSVTQADAPPAQQTSAEPAEAFDRDLRRASVTVRLSRAECARLHARAAEAGLTVSANLRSCTFEVESLRAQVKEALVELNASKNGKAQGGEKASGGLPMAEKPSWRTRLTQMLPRKSGGISFAERT